MRRKRGAGEGERQKGEGEAPREAKGYAGSDFHSQSHFHYGVQRAT